MSDLIVYQLDDFTASITLNQPRRRNAMTYAMWRSLGDRLEHLVTDGEARVLVLSGAGDQAFCAGNDISEFARWREDPERLRDYHQASGRVLRLLQQAPFAVIAKIRGACVGGGCELALACDFRYAADNARFAITPAKLGLGYSFEDVQRVVAALGAGAARRLLLSGRMYSAGEALSLRLADAVFPAADLDAAVADLAAELAANAPLTIQALKAAIAEVQRPAAEQDRTLIQELVDRCHASEDYREGRRAFAEKRPPRFRGV